MIATFIRRVIAAFDSRVWYERPDEFIDLSWYNLCGVPFRGTDEMGRRCLTFGFAVLGFVTVAYRKCKCVDCAQTREQTLRFQQDEAVLDARYDELEQKYGKDMADDWLGYQLRMQSMPRDGAPRV